MQSSRAQGQSPPDIWNPRLFALVAVVQGHAKPFDVPGGYSGSQAQPCGPEGHGLPKSRAIEFVCPDQFAECLGTFGGVYLKVCPQGGDAPLVLTQCRGSVAGLVV